MFVCRFLLEFLTFFLEYGDGIRGTLVIGRLCYVQKTPFSFLPEPFPVLIYVHANTLFVFFLFFL